MKIYHNVADKTLNVMIYSGLSPGILVIGNFMNDASAHLVEFWSEADPEEGSCELSGTKMYVCNNSEKYLID